MKKPEDQLKRNISMLLYAHGYSVKKAKSLGYKPYHPSSIEPVAESWGASYSMLETSEDICRDLYGECRFSENLSLLLDRRKENYQEMADKLELSYGILQSWIHGRRKPLADDLQRIAEFFGVSTIELLYGVPEIHWKVKEAAMDQKKKECEECMFYEKPTGDSHRSWCEEREMFVSCWDTCPEWRGKNANV